MQIVYGEKLDFENSVTVDNIAKVCGITFETATLLFYRGIDTPSKAKDFLNPGKHAFHDPFLLRGMRAAVNLINKAKEQNKNVLIFGDYDVDGISSVAILKNCLEDFGITPDYIVPEREEGYGLNLQKIIELNGKKKIDLLITVDCGISDHDIVEEIKKLGIDVIVTDHHEPPQVIPETIVINPKIEGQDYPFQCLAGAGVAYKLGNALIGDKADKYLDITALATVADSMDLVGENRHIVAEGLKIFNSPDLYPPLKEILSDVNKTVTAGTIAYTVSPRINAGGRMGDANTALKLMTSKNPNDIHDFATKLYEYNLERQVGCESVYKEAKEKINKNHLVDNKVIMVRDDHWGAGFIGIVASRLVDEYMRPVIVFAKHGDNYKGSCRSVDGINIFDALSSAKDLLVTFGGHSGAAGVTVTDENFDLLQDKLNEFLEENYNDYVPEKKVFVDMLIKENFSLDFAREIEKMEPFGTGNKRPLFAIEVNDVKTSPIKMGSLHFELATDKIQLLDFNGGADVEILSLPVDKTLLFDINYSVYKGKESHKGYLRHILANATVNEDVSLSAFSSMLKSILVEETEEEKIICDDDLRITSGHGTLYIITDPINLSEYDTGDVSVEYFCAREKSVLNRLLIAPSCIPDGYKNIVYLDEPLKFFQTDGKSYCNYSLCGYENLEYVETDRETFAEIYKILCSFDGHDFYSSAWLYNEYKPTENGYQFVFSTEVFIELGLFKIENGKLRKIDGVKNPLTNSKIFNKVLEIRG